MGAKLLIGLALLIAVAFIVLAALPYYVLLSPREVAERSLSETQLVYWPRRGWLLMHIAGGMVALLAGPVQMWLGLGDRRMDLHRKLGLVYIGGMIVGSIGAIALAFKTDFGIVFGSGLFFLAVAWITTTTFAYVAIRKGLLNQHKEWTIRSYVVTFAFVTFRLFQVAMQSAGIGTPLQEIEVMSWACWAIPLLITEVVLQSRRIALAR
jgi:hypothetical protein